MDSNSLLSMNLALNVARKCRICGMDILDLTCAFPIFGNDRLDQKLERYLQLHIQIDDLLPKCVCGSCYLKLESIDQFALMANRTEEAFRAWITRLRGLNCPVEAAKNVNVVLPLFRPNPEGGTERKKGHIFLPPKDPPTANPVPIAVLPNPAGGIATEKGIISYSDLKLGLLIKDQELLKLILKALKWAENDRRATFEVLIQRLKNTSFREILSNRNLLNDSDLTQLLKSYIGQGVMNSFVAGPAGAVPLNNNVPPTIILQQQQQQLQQSTPLQLNQTSDVMAGSNKVTIKNISSTNVPRLLPSGVSEDKIEDGGVTQMEVGVDPDLYLPYEDEDSSSTTKFDGRIDDRQENTVTIKLVTTNVAGDMVENRRMIPAILNVRGNKRFKCSACPECFETNTELQQHIVTRHLPRSNRTVFTQQGKPAIKIRVRKHKPLVGSPTPTVISPSPPALSLALPITEQSQSPSPSSPLKIVPLKIPASTTITVIPTPSQAKPVEPDTNNEIPEPKASTEERAEPIADKQPKQQEQLVRKSKRKTTFKLDPNVKIKLVSLKTRKIRKEEQPKESTPALLSPPVPPKTRKTTITPYCALCRKKLPPQETLRKHMEREHSLYECEKCDRTFKSPLNLGRHRQYHASVATTTSLTKTATTSQKEDAPKAANQPPGEETTYSCTHCGKAFRRSHHLKLHLRHHVKESVATPSAPVEKPTSGNGLRSRTKLAQTPMPVSILRSAEGSRTRNSDETKRKGAITRKIRFAS